ISFRKNDFPLRLMICAIHNGISQSWLITDSIIIFISSSFVSYTKNRFEFRDVIEGIVESCSFEECSVGGVNGEQVIASHNQEDIKKISTLIIDNEDSYCESQEICNT
ncbi:hypothetical protein PFISCL1PPCAC_14944, partial [Pristionchus fissidentatus]